MDTYSIPQTVLVCNRIVFLCKIAQGAGDLTDRQAPFRGATPYPSQAFLCAKFVRGKAQPRKARRRRSYRSSSPFPRGNAVSIPSFSLCKICPRQGATEKKGRRRSYRSSSSFSEGQRRIGQILPKKKEKSHRAVYTPIENPAPARRYPHLCFALPTSATVEPRGRPASHERYKDSFNYV